MDGHIASFYLGVRLARVHWIASLEGFDLPRIDASAASEGLSR